MGGIPGHGARSAVVRGHHATVTCRSIVPATGQVTDRPSEYQNFRSPRVLARTGTAIGGEARRGGERHEGTGNGRHGQLAFECKERWVTGTRGFLDRLFSLLFLFGNKAAQNRKQIFRGAERPRVPKDESSWF